MRGALVGVHVLRREISVSRRKRGPENMVEKIKKNGRSRTWFVYSAWTAINVADEWNFGTGIPSSISPWICIPYCALLYLVSLIPLFTRGNDYFRGKAPPLGRPHFTLIFRERNL